jgi:hypothetical protein
MAIRIWASLQMPFWRMELKFVPPLQAKAGRLSMTGPCDGWKTRNEPLGRGAIQTGVRTSPLLWDRFWIWEKAFGSAPEICLSVKNRSIFIQNFTDIVTSVFVHPLCRSKMGCNAPYFLFTPCVCSALQKKNVRERPKKGAGSK